MPGVAATVGDGVAVAAGAVVAGAAPPAWSLVMEARPMTRPPRNSTTASSTMVSRPGMPPAPNRRCSGSRYSTRARWSPTAMALTPPASANAEQARRAAGPPASGKSPSGP